MERKTPLTKYRVRIKTAVVVVVQKAVFDLLISPSRRDIVVSLFVEELPLLIGKGAEHVPCEHQIVLESPVA